MQLSLLSTGIPESPPLWDFQASAVQGVLDALDSNPILVSPTGSGKTRMAAEIYLRHGGRMLWIAEREELIDQASDAIQSVTGACIGFIKGGRTPDPNAPVQVASVQTLARRRMIPSELGLVIVDECHHCVAPQYTPIFEAIENVPLVGLTATPFRLDGRGLGERGFKTIIVAAYPDELIARGRLMAPRVFEGHVPNLKGVHKFGGDYAIGELAERCKDIGLVGNIVETWLAKANGMKTVAYCVNIEHSKMISDQFRAAGIPSEHVDGKTHPDVRRGVIERFNSGETVVVCNSQLYLEGWDYKALQCVIDASPTASLQRHLQKIGRVVRVCEGKSEAIYLDHAGNHARHGLMTRRLEYSLDGVAKSAATDLGLKRCPTCLLMVERPVTQCPDCGFEWTAQECVPRKTKMVDGELVEYTEDHEWLAAEYAVLLRTQEQFGFKDGFASVKFHERFGHWPVVAFGELVDVKNATVEQKREVYVGLLQKAKEKGFSPGWAAHQYKNHFGVWPSGFVAQAKAEVLGADHQVKRIAEKLALIRAGKAQKPVTTIEEEDDFPW